MKILVISDIHENFDNLSRVLQKIPDLGVEMIFCLGDLINGGIARMIASQDIPTHLVWGNNDGNKVPVTKIFLSAGNNSIVSNNSFDKCQVGGKRIFLTHYPLLAGSISKSGDYDAVFYGHDHILHQEMRGECLLFNPGEISAHKTSRCTFGVYDSDSNTVEILEIDNPISIKTNVSKEFISNLRLNKEQISNEKL